MRNQSQRSLIEHFKDLPELLRVLELTGCIVTVDRADASKLLRNPMN